MLGEDAAGAEVTIRIRGVEPQHPVWFLGFLFFHFVVGAGRISHVKTSLFVEGAGDGAEHDGGGGDLLDLKSIRNGEGLGRKPELGSGGRGCEEKDCHEGNREIAIHAWSGCCCPNLSRASQWSKRVFELRVAKLCRLCNRGGMIVLPIAERELRVTARLRSTAWQRVLAAVIALLLGAGFCATAAVTGTSTARFGPPLFGTITWLALATVLAAGLFLTSDAISEEKREGTLGFLFLTDLAGFDIVSGKLLATSLRAGYSTLAIFPILAVTVLMGGVTGGQFFRCTLALVNALFCSLSAGLLVSAISRDSQRALAGTVLLLLVICALGPLLDQALSVQLSLIAKLSLTSPVFVFRIANASGRADFWWGLLITHGLSWLMLIGAAALVRQTWHDRPARRLWVGPVFETRGRPTRALERAPVIWMTRPLRSQLAMLWLLALGSCVGFAAGAVALSGPSRFVLAQVNWLFVVGMYLWTASQSPRFLVGARRSGLLELLLVSPLTSREIVDGQWRALVRALAAPVVILVLVQVATDFVSQRATFGMGLRNSGQPLGSLAEIVLPLLIGLLSAVTTLANVVSLVWVGMWFGLTNRRTSIATLKSLGFVQVLPALAISVVSTLLAALITFGQFAARGTAPSNLVMMSFPLIMAGISSILSLGKDAAFLVWASRRLRDQFREKAAQAGTGKLKFQPEPNPKPVPPIQAIPGGV